MQLDKKYLQNLIFKYKTRKKDTSTGRINFLLFILSLYFVGNFVFVNCNILKQLKRTIKINSNNEDHKNTSKQDDLWGSNNIVDSSDISPQMISHVQQNALVLDQNGNKVVDGKNTDKVPDNIKKNDSTKSNNTTKSDNDASTQINSSEVNQSVKSSNETIKNTQDANVKSSNNNTISTSDNSKNNGTNVKADAPPTTQSSVTKKEPCENPVEVSSIICNDVYISNVDNPCNEGFFFHKCKGECVKKC